MNERDKDRKGDEESSKVMKGLVRRNKRRGIKELV